MDVTTDDAFRSFLPGQNQEDDRALIVRFFVDKKLLGAKSHEAGMPVYEDREYCEIRIKGQPKQITVEEVKPIHRQRFPIAYQAFLQKKELPMVGTPIEMLPGMGPSMAAHLKTLGVRSIEDMANLNEIGIQNIGGGARDLQKRAKAWIAQSNEKSVALAGELEAERAARQRDREEFEARLAALEGKKAAAKPRKARAPRSVQPPAPETQQ